MTTLTRLGTLLSGLALLALGFGLERNGDIGPCIVAFALGLLAIAFARY